MNSQQFGKGGKKEMGKLLQFRSKKDTTPTKGCKNNDLADIRHRYNVQQWREYLSMAGWLSSRPKGDVAQLHFAGFRKLRHAFGFGHYLIGYTRWVLEVIIGFPDDAPPKYIIDANALLWEKDDGSVVRIGCETQINEITDQRGNFRIRFYPKGILNIMHFHLWIREQQLRPAEQFPRLVGIVVPPLRSEKERVFRVKASF